MAAACSRSGGRRQGQCKDIALRMVIRESKQIGCRMHALVTKTGD